MYHQTSRVQSFRVKFVIYFTLISFNFLIAVGGQYQYVNYIPTQKVLYPPPSNVSYLSSFLADADKSNIRITENVACGVGPNGRPEYCETIDKCCHVSITPSVWNCCNNGQTCITGPRGGYCQNPNRNVHCGNGKGGTPEYCVTADKCCQVTLYPPVWHCCDYSQSCNTGPRGSICSNYNNVKCGNGPDDQPEYCGRADKCCQVSKSPSVWNCCNNGQTCTIGPYGGRCTNAIMKENVACGNGPDGQPEYCGTADKCCQVSKSPSVWNCCNNGQVCTTSPSGGKCSNVAAGLKTGAKSIIFYSILFLFVPYFYIY